MKSKENVKSPAVGYKELAEENERLKAALNYIALLSNIKNPHLGRPRLSDKDCIFCMAYFALNNGGYGCKITKEEYEQLFKEKKRS